MRRWVDSIRHDLTDNGLSDEDAQDRASSAKGETSPKH